MILFSMLLTSCHSAGPQVTPEDIINELIVDKCSNEPFNPCCLPPPYRTYGCYSRMGRSI
jgi:hypothetical protein